jgi:Ca-activated chloride channel homolog
VLLPLALLAAVGIPAAAQTASPAASTPVMVVLDASSSMKQADAPGPRIDAAKRAIGDLVTALPDGVRVGLMAFGTATGPTKADKAEGCKDVRTLVPVQPLDRAGFTSVVGGIRASGFTPIGTALRAAAAELPSAGPRSVVLVSDGEDTCAPPQPCQVASELKAAGVDLVVHTIGFKVEAKARSELSCVAAATGGSYREASSGADLARTLTSQVQRAIRPYAAVGTPVRGGATPADAPTVGPGQYLDTYERGASRGSGDGTVKYYAVELRKGDTPWFSATLAPPAVRAEFLNVLAVRLNLVDAAGQDCGVSSGAAVDLGVFGKVVAQTALLEAGPVGDRRWGASCAAGGRLYLKVTRVGDAFAAQSLPLELAFRLEPAVTDPGPPAVDELAPQLPAPAAGKPVEIDGGTSFNDAPRLEPGTYTETVGSGETRYYRVRLGWGQRLTYRVGIPGQPGLGIQAGALYAAIASPLRQPAEQSSGSDSSVLVGRDDHELSGSTPASVRYANRDAARSQAVPYSVDGDYYLVLDLSYPVGSKVPFSVPVTITVATEGAAEPGPTYAANPATYGVAPTTAVAAPPARAEPASGLPGWALATAATGVAVVAALALRRRRAGRAH